MRALADGRPEGYGWREIIATAAGALGARPALAPLPALAVLAFGAASGLASGLLGSTPILTLGKARELVHRDWSIAPEERAPDAPRPRYDLEDGFVDTVAWYRGQGWL